MRNPVTILLTVCLAGASVLAFAKRAAPSPVPAVIVNGVRYSAPHESMGFILAIDTQSGATLWRRQIYAVVANPKVEADIQDCYITAVKTGPDCLLIKNELNYEYQLNLETLEVVPIKGKIAVQRLSK